MCSKVFPLYVGGWQLGEEKRCTSGRAYCCVADGCHGYDLIKIVGEGFV